MFAAADLVAAIGDNFGFATDFCGGTAVTRAVANGKANDIDGQISAQIAATGVTSKDLFVVMVGMNDIIELYEQFPARSEADLTNELKARGELGGRRRRSTASSTPEGG